MCRGSLIRYCSEDGVTHLEINKINHVFRRPHFYPIHFPLRLVFAIETIFISLNIGCYVLVCYLDIYFIRSIVRSVVR